jgi:hypothetical protein
MTHEQSLAVAEILDRAAAEFDEHGLSRGHWAVKADGTPCDALDPDAVALCTMASLIRAFDAMEPRDEFPLWRQAKAEAVEALRRHIYGGDSILRGSISSWSDRAVNATEVATELRKCASDLRTAV